MGDRTRQRIRSKIPTQMRYLPKDSRRSSGLWPFSPVNILSIVYRGVFQLDTIKLSRG